MDNMNIESSLIAFEAVSLDPIIYFEHPRSSIMKRIYVRRNKLRIERKLAHKSAQSEEYAHCARWGVACSSRCATGCCLAVDTNRLVVSATVICNGMQRTAHECPQFDFPVAHRTGSPSDSVIMRPEMLCYCSLQPVTLRIQIAVLG